MNEKRLLAALLDCGEIDVDRLLGIEIGILEEAINRLRDEGVAINFPTLFREAVMVAAERHGMTEDILEVDGNYLAARVYVSSKRANDILSKYGFPVLF